MGPSLRGLLFGEVGYDGGVGLRAQKLFGETEVGIGGLWEVEVGSMSDGVRAHLLGSRTLQAGESVLSKIIRCIIRRKRYKEKRDAHPSHVRPTHGWSRSVLYRQFEHGRRAIELS